jgi:hypothetical protein
MPVMYSVFPSTSLFSDVTPNILDVITRKNVWGLLGWGPGMEKRGPGYV